MGNAARGAIVLASVLTDGELGRGAIGLNLFPLFLLSIPLRSFSPRFGTITIEKGSTNDRTADPTAKPTRATTHPLSPFV